MEDRIILVTGGATGLGKAIVEEFLEEDEKNRVIFTYLKSKDKADKIINEYGERVYGIQVDATNYKEVQISVFNIIEKFGKVDVLVNNVAAAKDAPIGEHTPETWDFTIRNTLYSSFNYINVLTENFSKNNKGKIINIGSVNGLRGREGSVAYSTAKAGLIGLTKTAAKELGKYNVNVNLIAPGYIDTDAQKKTSLIIKNVVLSECAIRKLTQPKEIAQLVTFLASNKADAITGQIYKVDRGQYI